MTTTSTKTAHTGNSFHFAVEQVELATENKATKPIRDALRMFLGFDGEEVESLSVPSESDLKVLPGVHYHPLLAAVFTAYSLHYPLSLSPDAIWITICQGIAHHMIIHGARLRKKFAREETGKVTLPHSTTKLKLDANAMTEDWSAGIRDHVGDEMADILTCNFSTTTPIDRTVSHVTMMDIFRRYFRYKMVCICGLPSVTLEGTVEDWQLLRQKAEQALAAFEMEWWSEDLLHILDEFVLARNGTIDLIHWRDICKIRTAYGGSIINGWIGKLFPYLCSFRKGPCTIRNPDIGSSVNKGFHTSSAPSGLSKVPFDCVDATTNRTIVKELLAGFLGVTQDPHTLALRPMTGWAIRKAPKMDQVVNRLMHDDDNILVSKLPPEEWNLCDAMPKHTGNIPLPADLDRVYHEIREARVGFKGHSIHILPMDAIRQLNQRWSRIATLDNGQCVVADLRQSIRDWRTKIKWDDRDRFCVVCVCKEDNNGEDANRLDGPVVANSIFEWLQKSLDWVASDETCRKGACYYWEASSFHAVGTLQNPTRSYDELLARVKTKPMSQSEKHLAVKKRGRIS